MVARITITSEELRTASTNFANKAGEIRKILEYLRSEVNRLESTWDGAAQDQFFIHDLRRNGKNNGAVPGSCGWHQPAAECRCADFGRDRSGIDRLSQRLIRQGQIAVELFATRLFDSFIRRDFYGFIIANIRCSCFDCLVGL